MCSDGHDLNGRSPGGILRAIVPNPSMGEGGCPVYEQIWEGVLRKFCTGGKQVANHDTILLKCTRVPRAHHPHTHIPRTPERPK